MVAGAESQRLRKQSSLLWGSAMNDDKIARERIELHAA
jgi:hypothetical protein